MNNNFLAIQQENYISFRINKYYTKVKVWKIKEIGLKQLFLICFYIFSLTVVQLKTVFTKDYNMTVLKNVVFWDVTPCGSCKNRRFGGI
jgi:hypothetical protein